MCKLPQKKRNITMLSLRIVFQRKESSQANVTSLISSSKYRSSHQRFFMQKGVLRNFTKFTGKHLCLHLCLRPATLLKKRLWHRCFLVNFAKFLRTPLLQSTSGYCFSKYVTWISDSYNLTAVGNHLPKVYQKRSNIYITISLD